jgi:hypothetical protein
MKIDMIKIISPSKRNQKLHSDLVFKKINMQFVQTLL